MKTVLTILMAITLAACGGGGGGDRPRSTPTPPASDQVTGWEIGPIRDGHNYSLDLPLHPSRHPDGWAIHFGPQGEPHYITRRTGSLAGKFAIQMTLRLDAAAGVRVHGAKCPVTSPGSATLYFSTGPGSLPPDGGRWWATFATVWITGPGEWTITARLDGPWTSVEKKTWANAPAELEAAKRNAYRLGFTLGNCEGYGHGIRATGPATLVVTDFRVLDEDPDHLAPDEAPAYVGERG